MRSPLALLALAFALVACGGSEPPSLRPDVVVDATATDATATDANAADTTAPRECAPPGALVPCSCGIASGFSSCGVDGRLSGCACATGSDAGLDAALDTATPDANGDAPVTDAAPIDADAPVADAPSIDAGMMCGGTACAARPGTAVTCAGAECVYSCRLGFADCNALEADGCEVNLRSDAVHCGSCDRACGFRNGVGVCRDAACVFATCNAGFGDCDGNLNNGCEMNLRTAVANCGACGHAYAGSGRFETEAVCDAGSCATRCRVYSADCDGNEANGCEVSLCGDPANCGRCGQACTPLPHTIPVCGGCAGPPVCAQSDCAPGWLECDRIAGNGCEANPMNDPRNCGGCERACPAGQVCTDGSCELPPAPSATVVACAGTTPAATVTAPGFAFTPMTSTISVGQVVDFNMPAIHDAQSSDGLWHADFNTHTCVRFNATGTYGFRCVPHGFLGSVIVR